MNDAELLELCKSIVRHFAGLPSSLEMRDNVFELAREVPRLLREKQEAESLLRGWLDLHALQHPDDNRPGKPGSLYAETVAALKEPKP